MNAGLGSLSVAAASILASVCVFAPASEARACGGTFCDAGPSPMPVDQTGENILFVMRDGVVEAHVQIQYRGDPESFAWVVPVMAVPEVEAGSDQLFTNLLDATVPTFTLSTRSDDCGSDEDSSGCGFVSDDSPEAGGTFGGNSQDDDDHDDGSPEIVAKGVAGAFQYAVLEGGNVEGVVAWLDENGYAQDDEAPDLLADYLDDGFLFVAFKLRGGTGVDEIHPVVIRYAGDEPCVPIRLTRIAATDDMGIRAFFLGDARVAPTNFRSVEINPMRIDWLNPSASYGAVVTEAVDIEGSDGQGFVTEYAGPTRSVPRAGLLDPRWDASEFLEATPEQAVAELGLQGLLRCDDNECTAAHPLIPGILDRFIPRPTGVAFEEFYGCLECFEDEADPDAWSPTEFTEELEARIIGPGGHALDVLDANPYLTRLFTTISPHEMTVDPTFHPNPDLPELSNTYTATRVFTCEGPDYVEFPDGRRLALAGDGSLPMEIPAAIRVDEVPPFGAPMVVSENDAQVEDRRESWNVAQGLVEDSGCNCRSRRHGAAGFGWAFLVLGLGWWARRPRRAV